MTKQYIFSLITATRKEKGITQLKLAQLVGIREFTLIRNLKKENEMTLGTLLKILDILEIKLKL